MLEVPCVAGTHSKAGKPMTTIEEPAGPDSDGRRSKTPNGGMKLLEANRCVSHSDGVTLPTVRLISWVSHLTHLQPNNAPARRPGVLTLPAPHSRAPCQEPSHPAGL